jgi:hypothetical protein
MGILKMGNDWRAMRDRGVALSLGEWAVSGVASGAGVEIEVAALNRGWKGRYLVEGMTEQARTACCRPNAKRHGSTNSCLETIHRAAPR